MLLGILCIAVAIIIFAAFCGITGNGWRTFWEVIGCAALIIVVLGLFGMGMVLVSNAILS